MNDHDIAVSFEGDVESTGSLPPPGTYGTSSASPSDEQGYPQHHHPESLAPRTITRVNGQASTNGKAKAKKSVGVDGRRHLKMRCSRTAPCLSCKMRGDECVWIGAAPNGTANEDELEATQSEVTRLKKLVDLLLAKLEEQDAEINQYFPTSEESSYGAGPGQGPWAASTLSSLSNGLPRPPTSMEPTSSSSSNALPYPPEASSAYHPSHLPHLHHPPYDPHQPGGLPLRASTSQVHLSEGQDIVVPGAGGSGTEGYVEQYHGEEGTSYSPFGLRGAGANRNLEGPR
ncbi:hypothetical protein JCM10212_002623 [Sporobolomyces blumeae]